VNLRGNETQPIFRGSPAASPHGGAEKVYYLPIYTQAPGWRRLIWGRAL